MFNVRVEGSKLNFFHFHFNFILFLNLGFSVMSQTVTQHDMISHIGHMSQVIVT